MSDVKVRAALASNFNVTSGQSTVGITIPTGLSVGDPIRLYFVQNSNTSGGTLTPPANWTAKLARTVMGTGNIYIFERTGGWQTADGNVITFGITGATASSSWAYGVLALKVGCAFGTDGTLNIKSSSTTTSVAPAIAGSVAGDDCGVVFFGKMSGNLGNPVVTPDAQMLAQREPPDTASANLWLGSYTGASRDQTITYDGPTANGAGKQFLITGSPSSGQTILRGIIASGSEVVGATLRGAIAGGIEVAGTTLRGPI